MDAIDEETYKWKRDFQQNKRMETSLGNFIAQSSFSFLGMIIFE